MRRKGTKRLTALLLSAVLCLSMFPGTALAAGETEQTYTDITWPVSEKEWTAEGEGGLEYGNRDYFITLSSEGQLGENLTRSAPTDSSYWKVNVQETESGEEKYKVIDVNGLYIKDGDSFRIDGRYFSTNIPRGIIENNGCLQLTGAYKISSGNFLFLHNGNLDMPGCTLSGNFVVDKGKTVSVAKTGDSSEFTVKGTLTVAGEVLANGFVIDGGTVTAQSIRRDPSTENTEITLKNNGTCQIGENLNVTGSNAEFTYQKVDSVDTLILTSGTVKVADDATEINYNVVFEGTDTKTFSTNGKAFAAGKTVTFNNGATGTLDTGNTVLDASQLVIGVGATATVPSLTVPNDRTLTVKGSLIVNGTLENNGTVTVDGGKVDLTSGTYSGNGTFTGGVTVGPFLVTGGVKGTDFDFQATADSNSLNGANKLTIKTSTPLTISTPNNSESNPASGYISTAQKSDGSYPTANLTLAGVYLTSPTVGITPLGAGGSLTITLGEGSTNTLKGHEITAEGTTNTYGIYADTLTINGPGTLNTTGGAVTYSNNDNLSCGIRCSNAISITGGTVNATGGSVTTGSSYGIYATQQGSSITISGGSGTAQADTTATYKGAVAPSPTRSNVVVTSGAWNGTSVSWGAAPGITTQPSNASVTAGSTAKFTVAATGDGTLTYQWQVSTDEGNTWSDVSGGKDGNTNSYTTDTATMAMNGYKYRCVVNNSVNAEGTAVTSSAATLTVAPKTQTPPAVPTIASHTENSITLTSVADSTQSGGAAEYGIQNEDGTITWQDGPTFSGLTNGTDYTFVVRYKAKGDYGTSGASAQRVSKIPHSYTGTVTKEPTCMEHGIKTYTCSCGDYYTEDITKNPNNHNPVSVWTQEGEKHYHACLNGCGTHLNEADCSGGEATCKDAAVCKFCKMPYGKPNGHDYVYQKGTPATHEADGVKEHYICEDCDTLFDKDKQETTKEDLVLPMPGHKFSEEWKSNETQHWHECECGKKSSVFDHDFEWITDKDAQVGIAGSKHKECKVCGYAEAAVEIPALPIPEYPPVVEKPDGGKVEIDNPNPKPGDKVTIIPKPDDGKVASKVVVTDKDGNSVEVTDNGDGTYTFIQPDGKVTIKVDFEKKTDTKPADDTKSPQTGDSSNLWLWFALIFVSGGIITTIVYGKKKKQSMN